MSGRLGDSLRKVRTSVYLLTFGQCCSKTFRQYGSHSTCQIVLIPTRSKPRSKPPIPEKRDPCVSATKSNLPHPRPPPGSDPSQAQPQNQPDHEPIGDRPEALLLTPLVAHDGFEGEVAVGS